MYLETVITMHRPQHSFSAFSTSSTPLLIIPRLSSPRNYSTLTQRHALPHVFTTRFLHNDQPVSLLCTLPGHSSPSTPQATINANAIITTFLSFELPSIRLSRKRKKRPSSPRRRVASTPPPRVKPPPPIFNPGHTFPFSRAQSTPRRSYRSVQELFEEIDCADPSQSTTSRFAKSQAVTPPAKKPDPTKCNPRDRAVVRKLFQELQDFPNRSHTTRRPVSTHPASFVPDKSRRSTWTGNKGDNMPKGNDFHHPVSNSSETELASEVVTEIDQPSEVEPYEEVYRYEPGSASGPTEAHIYKVEDDGDDRTTTHHLCDHGDESEQQTEFQTVDDGHYEAARIIIKEHCHQEEQTDVQGTYREYQEQVYDGHQEQVYEEHTETNRNSANTANSFDEVAKEMAQDLQVLDRVDDSDLRNLAELIPERNQDRIFSEDEPSRVDDDGHERVHEVGRTSQGQPVIEGTDFITQVGDEDDDNDGAESEDSELLPELPKAPPSFVFRTERLSKNVADAMANVWDRFWSEDVKQISGIIKNRFSQLLPYMKRFVAHLIAFWGGITYLRRALTAFVRILNRDERIRELLERVGWASATTVKVFLSICGMVMQATLQMYYLMRNKIIPDTRRVIPIVYYKAVVKLLKLAEHSPWALVLGPFSLTFAIDSSKIPDRYFLHNKLSVPEEDVTFASADGVQTLVQSVRESIHRTRYGYGSQQSTPVHTQTTDEMPYPPPSEYTVSQFPEENNIEIEQHHHHHHASKHVKETVSRYAPLTERTNHDAHNHV